MPSLFPSILRKTGITLIIIAITVFLILLSLSPGTTTPITDSNGKVLPNSIATIEQPVIGGVKQTLIIRGENINNPVLLFVHGGPGMSTFPFIKEQFKGIEKLFTICYWEQRGAGRSYSKHIPSESMTLDQLIKDGAEISHYLTNKFHQPKIYILGHSWGSFLASFVIHKHPELYYAYIGIGQVANTLLSEQQSYQFVAAEAKKRNDKKALAILQRLKLPEPAASSQEWYDYFMIERKLVYQYGGARYGTERKISDMAKSVIACREYTIADKLTYRTGITYSMLHLCKYMIHLNPDSLLTEQQIPVYIFQGLHDRQTDFLIARNYFNHLKAPLKKFYAFEHSAHAPHQEEYEIFKQIIERDILIQLK